MINSFNFAYDNGSFSISLRRGIITQRYKDTTLLDNLERLMSLLNTDYKILTWVIAKRLKKCYQK